VRESIQRMLAQAGVNHEIAGSELADKLEDIRRRNAEAKAQAELAELKRKRRPPLAPMNIFTEAAKAAANGDIEHGN
jgi:benzoyl-CoA reductase/2-hydroxyglutaryl-CoA dehydratase subunit BcrC/BadD/HgdB